MKFQEEKIADTIEEAKPLLKKHWQEIAHYKDIDLDPDYDLYLKMESAGVTKTFICRDDDNIMIGYAVYFIRHHLHYRKTLYAYQDIVFVDPERRGAGMFFIRWCDEQLKKHGCHVVSQHIKAAHNFGPALERLGYELQDLIYSKRLDK